jgi:hypothetical protein
MREYECIKKSMKDTSYKGDQVMLEGECLEDSEESDQEGQQASEHVNSR